VKCAAIQLAPVFKAVDENIRTAAGLVAMAASAGAQLTVLPELIYGYSFMSKAEAAPFAEVLRPEGGGPSFTMFRRLSAQLQVAIAWGVMERDPGTNKLYNSQCLVLPDGQYTSYRKLNRWGQDYIWSTEGRGSPPIVDFMGKKVGLLICRDIRDKATNLDDLYESGDTDLVAFSTAWGRGGFPAVSWMNFAKSNKTWLIVANRYGIEANNDFGGGGSCVISPEGEVHCEGLVWNQPCIVYAEV
jgi:predicted amidohydrolase